MSWAWMVMAVAGAILLTAGIVAVIEYVHSDQPLSDWHRARRALGRAVDRSRGQR